MTHEEKEIVECNVHESGICGLHHVEVERRRAAHRATDKSILSLEGSLKELAEKLPGISRTVYAIFVGGALLLTMVTAGFVYTRDTGQRAIARDSKLTEQQELLTEKLTQMAISAARSEGQQSTLMTEMRTFTLTAQKILLQHKELDNEPLKDNQ